MVDLKSEAQESTVAMCVGVVKGQTGLSDDCAGVILSKYLRASFISSKKREITGCWVLVRLGSTPPTQKCNRFGRGAQGAQYPLIKEYTLNHIRDPNLLVFRAYSLFMGHRALWGPVQNSVALVRVLGLKV